MLNFSRLQIRAIIGGLLLIMLFAVPSFVPENIRNTWPGFVPKSSISLGLDLAGGSYLLLEADTKDVATQRLKQMQSTVRSETRRAPRIDTGEIKIINGSVHVMITDPSKVDAVRERLNSYTSGVGTTGQRDWDINVVNGHEFVLTPSQAGLDAAVDRAMGDATEVVRKRIDALGTREPTILRQGSNRIVVQVPGLKDPKALKDQLGHTAKLEFMLVDERVSRHDLVTNAPLPDDSAVLPYAEDNQGIGKIAVRTDDVLTGDQLIDARMEFDQQTNQPGIAIQFDGAGSKHFAKLSTENVNKRFAIILDNQVISAPVFNEPIMGGQARISGSFSSDSASQLAISLRSGKLPVALKVIQESTVSPELGADSIKAGITASIIAAVAVIAFMILTYGRFGVYATIAVVINVLVILAVMSVLTATLTLPGIAGFVLTIGTAVDANVLINERIREERRRGRAVIQAIEFGYKEASRTIFEANVTHAIAGGIMLILGSGPIRGFAIVLLIGIATSVFTAVVFTRMLVALWVRRNRPTEIHI
jgi:preprotein translocase subunit SecD